MNLIWNVDSKQSEIKEAAVKKVFVVIAYMKMPKAYIEPYQRSIMECFPKIVNAKKLWTILSFVLDVFQGSEYGFGGER